MNRDSRRACVRWIEPGERLGMARGEVTICVLSDSTDNRLASCLESVFEHTAAEVPIVLGSRTPDVGADELQRVLKAGASERGLVCARTHEVVRAAAPGDVVVLSPGCVVTADWLDGLRAAAYAEPTVATASPLIVRDGMASIGPRTRRELADAPRSESRPLRPRLARPAAACSYVRRSAFELVNDRPGSELFDSKQQAEFSRDCVAAGLHHVLADDVVVVAESWTDADDTDEEQPVLRSLRRAFHAFGDLSVAVDARILAGPTTGTHVQVLAVITALARTRRLRLSVVVPDDLNPEAASTLESLPAVRVVAHTRAQRLLGEGTDIIHRPCQVNDPGDLSLLASLADRFVVTHQDLIRYHNPSYFADADVWDGYRQLTRRTLALADHVVFVSAHSREDALSEQLVEPSRAAVVHNGVDHIAAGVFPSRPRPTGLLPDDAEVILCIGTDYRHKNRVFALRVLEQLHARHGWPGYLVFAGTHVAVGSSRRDEVEWLGAHPECAARVIDCSAVTEAEKAWLYDRAALVLYPTTFEGFGLVPFEAARHGVPCAWASGTSLSEVLPDENAVLVPWDAAESADRVIPLLLDQPARERHVTAVRAASAGFTWDDTAARLIDLYHAVCDAPPSPFGVLARGEGLLNGVLSEDAMKLLGPGGVLPRDLERPLLALATHPRLGNPVFGALRLGYRAGFTLRRLRGNRRST